MRSGLFAGLAAAAVCGVLAPSCDVRDEANREQALEVMTFPPTHPVAERVLADASGNVWLQHYQDPQSAGPYTWSVFGSDGRWLGDVTTPERVRVTDIGVDYVLGVETDAVGVEYVALYALTKV